MAAPAPCTIAAVAFGVVSDAEQPFKPPEPWRSMLLNDYLDSKARLSVFRSCTAGRDWVQSRARALCARVAMDTVSYDVGGSPLTALQQALHSRSPLQSTVQLAGSHDETALLQVLRALQPPHGGHITHVHLPVATSALLATLPATVLQQLTLDTLNCSLPPAARLPHLQALHITAVQRPGLCASVAPYMQQLHSLTLGSTQPGHGSSKPDSTACRWPWVLLFPPGTSPSTTLRSVATDEHLSDGFVGTLLSHAPYLEHVAATGGLKLQADHSSRSCSWSKVSLGAGGTDADELLCLPTSTSLVEVQCALVAFEQTEDITAVLDRYTFTGLTEVLLSVGDYDDAVAHSSHPAALIAALEQLSTLSTPTTTLNLFLATDPMDSPDWLADLLRTTAQDWTQLGLTLYHCSAQLLHQLPLPQLSLLNIPSQVDAPMLTALLEVPHQPDRLRLNHFSLTPAAPTPPTSPPPSPSPPAGASPLRPQSVSGSGPGQRTVWSSVETYGVQRLQDLALLPPAGEGREVTWVSQDLLLDCDSEQVADAVSTALSLHLTPKHTWKVHTVTLQPPPTATPAEHPTLLRANLTLLNHLKQPPAEVVIQGYVMTPAVVRELAGLPAAWTCPLHFTRVHWLPDTQQYQELAVHVPAGYSTWLLSEPLGVARDGQLMVDVCTGAAMHRGPTQPLQVVGQVSTQAAHGVLERCLQGVVLPLQITPRIT